jgi:hypothetical protein
VGLAGATGFFEAPAFSCLGKASERPSRAPQQIKIEEIERTTTVRRKPVCMSVFLPVRAGFGKHFSVPRTPAMEFSRLPQVSSTVL